MAPDRDPVPLKGRLSSRSVRFHVNRCEGGDAVHPKEQRKFPGLKDLHLPLFHLSELWSTPEKPNGHIQLPKSSAPGFQVSKGGNEAKGSLVFETICLVGFFLGGKHVLVGFKGKPKGQPKSILGGPTLKTSHPYALAKVSRAL